MNKKSIKCLNSFTLKIIAIVSMVIDHVGYIFYPDIFAFRAVGRIAFPIFCFLITEGFYHTRSHVNYLIRLAVFALLSELPFDLAFHHTLLDWGYQNVFITLTLGLLALFCLEEMNNRRIYCVPLALTICAAYFSNCDYGVGGVILICIFYLTKQTPWVRFLLCALVLYMFFGAAEMYGLLAMIPITLYNGKKGPGFQMFFYWFYPVHLLILYGIYTYL